MILLDHDIPLLKSVLQRKLIVPESGKPETIDTKITDDDGNLYHVHTMGKDRNRVMVEFGSQYFKDCKSINVMGTFKSLYKEFESGDASDGYDVAFIIEIDKVQEKIDKVAQLFSETRHNLYSCILNYFFKAMEAGKSESVLLNIRSNEKIVIQSFSDRVTVTFANDFSSDEDIIIGKIFMQEFKEGKKTGSNAPQLLVNYKEPQSELSKFPLPKGVNVGYVTFILNKNHTSGKNADKTIKALGNFFPYLKYHMKCSKAYLHSRMRAKTEDFVKVLNRAKPDVEVKEKKTFTGKTFNRA